MMQAQPHSSSYASNRIVMLLKQERDRYKNQCEYWKKRCTERTDAAHRDGFVAGVVMSLGSVFAVGGVALLFFW